MRVTLPSGEWVDLADKRKGNLAGKVAGAVMIEVVDGRQLIPGDIAVRQTDVWLRENITGWSLEDRGIPIPRAPGPNGMDRTEVIGDELDEDDYAALHEQVREMVTKTVGRPNPPQKATPALSAS